jgi:hypothetical protein
MKNAKAMIINPKTTNYFNKCPRRFNYVGILVTWKIIL